MKKKLFAAIVLFALGLPSPASAKVKLYLDDTFKKYIWVDKQDCSIHKKKESRLAFGLSFGNILFSVTPIVSYGTRVGIDWDRSVQAFISRYQALCERFNSGSMTRLEYDRETKKLEDINERMARLEKEARAASRKDKDEMFDRLDREMGKLHGTAVPNREKEKTFVSSLEQIRNELEPEKAMTLITPGEASREDRSSPPPSIPAALDNTGPEVKIVTPELDKAYKAPLRIIIHFIVKDHHEVDLSKLKLEYLKFFTIDITSRVKPYATREGINVPSAKLPRGKHTIRLTVGYVDGGITRRVFTVKVL